MPESRLRLQPSFPELASKEKTHVHTLCVQRSSRIPYLVLLRCELRFLVLSPSTIFVFLDAKYLQRKCQCQPGKQAISCLHCRLQPLDKGIHPGMDTCATPPHEDY